MDENPKNPEQVEIRPGSLMARIATEGFITRTYVGLLLRNFKKYKKLPTLSYVAPLTHVYRAFRPAYFFFRYMDDLADGDIAEETYGNFTTVTNRLRGILETAFKPTNGLELTMVEAMRRLGQVGKDTDNIRGIFIDFLDAMERERQRRMEQIHLPKAELESLYEQSFYPGIEVAFIAFRSENRNKDVPSLGTLLGKVYALKDIETELRNGITNIPKETLKQAHVDQGSLQKNPTKCIEGSDILQGWIRKEILQCEGEIKRIMNTQLDVTGSFLVKTLLLKGLQSDIANIKRLYGI